jgi:hypothetical protein
MMYIYFCFLLGPCILAGYLCIHIWDVQTLDFVYMVFMVYGLYLWFVFMASVWIVLMDCMGCVWTVCVCGLYGLCICMDIRS